MALTNLMVLSISVLSFSHHISCTFNASEASRLEDAILTNYHIMVRPADLVKVQIDFGLYHISSLNNIEQELSLVGYLILSWADSRLSWNSSEYGNLDKTYLKNSQIWTPPIVLANSADGLRLLNDDTDTKSIPIYISSAGYVIWLAVANYLVKCPIDITFYPFDTQMCSVKVSTWMYSSRDIKLMKDEEFVNLEQYEENGEWSLEGTDVTSGTRKIISKPILQLFFLKKKQVSTWMYSSRDIRLLKDEESVNLEQYEENGEWNLEGTDVTSGTRSLDAHGMSMLSFTLHLRRKHSYYILNMILPVVFTSFLGCLVFLLPMDSGERNGFALTILLALSVIMTVVSDKIPPTSTHVCILSVYLLCAMLISVIEAIVTVFIQRVYSKDGSLITTNGFLYKAILILGKTDRTTIKKDNDSQMAQKQHQLSSSKVVPFDFETCATNGEKVDLAIDDMSEVKVEGQARKCHVFDYKDVSVCLDRLCFIVFSSFTFIMTLTFLLIISQGPRH